MRCVAYDFANARGLFLERFDTLITDSDFTHKNTPQFILRDGLGGFASKKEYSSSEFDMGKHTERIPCLTCEVCIVKDV